MLNILIEIDTHWIRLNSTERQVHLNHGASITSWHKWLQKLFIVALCFSFSLLFIRLSVSLFAFTILHSYSVKFLAFWQDSLGGNSRTVMIGNLSFLSLWTWILIHGMRCFSWLSCPNYVPFAGPSFMHEIFPCLKFLLSYTLSWLSKFFFEHEHVFLAMKMLFLSKTDSIYST